MVTGTQMTHVPFKGGAEGAKEVVSGRIPIDYVTIVASISLVEAGRLRALAVSAPNRSGLLPNVPTMAEAGIAGAEMLTWFGLWAPAGTPVAIRDKIAADVKKVIEAPAMKARFVKLGFDAQAMSPAEFNGFVNAERAKFGKLIGALGLKKE